MDFFTNFKHTKNKDLNNLVSSMLSYRAAQDHVEVLEKQIDDQGWLMDLGGHVLMTELGVKHLHESNLRTTEGRFVSDLIADAVWQVDYNDFEELADKINLVLFEIEAGLV